MFINLFYSRSSSKISQNEKKENGCLPLYMIIQVIFMLKCVLKYLNNGYGTTVQSTNKEGLKKYVICQFFPGKKTGNYWILSSFKWHFLIINVDQKWREFGRWDEKTSVFIQRFVSLSRKTCIVKCINQLINIFVIQSYLLLLGSWDLRSSTDCFRRFGPIPERFRWGRRWLPHY